MLKKRVEAEIVEGVIAVMMALFGATAIYVLYKALILSRPDPLLVVVELMLLLLVGILALVFVGVKIWEQGIESNQHHKKTHQKLEEEP